MQSVKQVWGRYEGKNKQEFVFQGGFTRIILKRSYGGWMIRENKQESCFDFFSFEPAEQNTEDRDMSLFQTGHSEILFVQPALPVKPVVFRNNKSLAISPRQTFRIFLAIPVNVQFYYSQVDPEHLFSEYSTERLSDTWFGEPDNGEPAFSVGSRFAGQIDQLASRYFEATCPVLISNNSNQLLDLQRLIIHVENLNLYQNKEQLVTDSVSIEFKGKDLISNLHFSTEKSIQGEAPLLVGKARQLTNKNILGKSFHFIKNITQL